MEKASAQNKLPRWKNLLQNICPENRETEYAGKAIGIVLAFVVYDDFSVAIKKIQGKPFSYKKHHLKKDLYIPHKDDDYQEDEFDAFK